MTKEEFLEKFWIEDEKTFDWQSISKLKINYSDEISKLLLDYILENNPSSLNEEREIKVWNTLFYLITGIRVYGNNKFLTKLNNLKINFLREKYFSQIDIDSKSWLDMIIKNCFELKDNEQTITTILNLKKLSIETKKDYIRKNSEQINKKILNYIHDDKIKSIIKDIVFEYEENINNHFEKNDLLKIEIKNDDDDSAYKKFVDNISNCHQKFIEKVNKETERWNDLKKNHSSSFKKRKLDKLKNIIDEKEKIIEEIENKKNLIKDYEQEININKDYIEEILKERKAESVEKIEEKIKQEIKEKKKYIEELKDDINKIKHELGKDNVKKIENYEDEIEWLEKEIDEEEGIILDINWEKNCIEEILEEIYNGKSIQKIKEEIDEEKKSLIIEKEWKKEILKEIDGKGYIKKIRDKIKEKEKQIEEIEQQIKIKERRIKEIEDEFELNNELKEISAYKYEIEWAQEEIDEEEGMIDEIKKNKEQIEEIEQEIKTERKWIEENKKEIEKYEKLKNKKGKLLSSIKIKNISPENLSIKSPLTVFHSDWGGGKTFFFEELVLWFNKNKDEKIKKIKVINLWKHIHQQTNIIKEFNNILIKSISYSLPKKSKFLFFFSKIWKYLWWFNEKFKNSLKGRWWWFAHFISGILFKFTSYEKLIYKLSRKMETTIIIFDNIERLENLVPEIIKIIQFYSSYYNFIFVLSMNKNAVNFSNFVNIPGEDPIDKFNTLGVWFHYKQNYKPLLRKYGIPNDAIQKINEILNQAKIEKKSNAKTVLSIRELEKLLDLHYNGYNWDEDWNKIKYNFYWFFDKKIWQNNLIKDDVKEFISYINKHYNRLNSNQNMKRLEQNDPIFDEIIKKYDENDEIIYWFNHFLEGVKNKSNEAIEINSLERIVYKYIYNEIEKKYNEIKKIK